MPRRTILACLLSSLCAAAHAQVYVSLTGNNTTGNSWANAYTTVGAGVAAAGVG